MTIKSVHKCACRTTRRATGASSQGSWKLELVEGARSSDACFLVMVAP
jgi:hypothetical protein